MADKPDTDDSNIEQINNLISNEEEINIEEPKDTYEYTEEKQEEKKERPVEQPKKTDSTEKRPQERPQRKELPKKIEIVKKKNVSQRPKPVVLKQSKHAPKNSSKPARKVETHHPKKTTHKAYKEPRSKSRIWVWTAIGVVILALIVISIMLVGKQPGQMGNETTNEIAATVNGEPIYTKTIDDQYASINPALQKVYTKEFLLNQTINERLLLQEAKRIDLTATDAEIESVFTDILKINKITEEQVQQDLEEQGSSITALKEGIRNKLILQKLVNETVVKNTIITEKDIEAYYDTNADAFKEDARVTVSHVLVLVGGNISDTAAKIKIDDIAQQAKSKEFCSLVRKYSDDPGSIDNCGIYTFGKGEMVPEFEEASYRLKENETEVVKTVYGYHLIKKIEDLPARTIPLSEASADIKNTLFEERAQAAFETLLNDLRAKAKIVNYLEQKTAVETETKPITTSIQPATTSTSNPSTGTATKASNLDSFAQCLTDKDAKFYGTYWCPHCANQKQLFGESIKYIEYIECADKDNQQIQTPVCQAAEIQGYPTWIINGQKFAGEQSLEKLASVTGCKL